MSTFGVKNNIYPSLHPRHFPKKNPIALGADVDQAQSGTNILVYSGSSEPVANYRG